MEWKVFTYKKAEHNKEKPSFNKWLATLANGLHAEQVQVLNDTEVLIYYPSPWRDDFDANGEEKL